MKIQTKGFALACLMLAACGQKPGGSSGAGNEAGQEASSAVTPQEIAAELSQGNYGRAAELARAAVQAQPGNPEVYLLLARAEARQNNTGNAIDALDKAFENGFHDPRGAVNHPDFDKIRSTSEFRGLLKKWNLLAAALPSAQNSQGAASSETRAGDVSIMESGGKTKIKAGDVEIDE